MTRRDHILMVAEDLMGSFLYYDRKEDDTLPREAVEEAIKSGEILVAEILEVFKAALTP